MSTSAERRRRRRLLYLVGLVPSLLLLMVSGRIVLLLQHQSEAMSAYAAGDYERARDEFAANRVLNPIERWVAPFGEGDARFRLEDFEGAVGAFEAALELVPEERECMVRVNLALAHEALGDALDEDGSRTEALDAWQEGRQVLRPCKKLPDGAPPEDVEVPEDDVKAEDPDREQREDEERERDRIDREERAGSTAARVDARLADKLGVAGATDAQKPDEAPPEDEETREKRRELEERNKKAHEDNVKHKDAFDRDPEPSPAPEEPPPTPQW